MRRRTALLAGLASVVPVASVALAPSAAADDQVTDRREFRFDCDDATPCTFGFGVQVHPK